MRLKRTTTSSGSPPRCRPNLRRRSPRTTASPSSVRARPCTGPLRCHLRPRQRQGRRLSSPSRGTIPPIGRHRKRAWPAKFASTGCSGSKAAAVVVVVVVAAPSKTPTNRCGGKPTGCRRGGSWGYRNRRPLRQLWRRTADRYILDRTAAAATHRREGRPSRCSRTVDRTAPTVVPGVTPKVARRVTVLDHQLPRNRADNPHSLERPLNCPDGDCCCNPA